VGRGETGEGVGLSSIFVEGERERREVRLREGDGGRASGVGFDEGKL